MPVSLQRLITEREAAVINEGLTRACIQVQGTDVDAAEAKRRSLPFRAVESLAFSFRSIAAIENLRGLDSLTKLQLDNNNITAIQNLSHLTRLTWLDLSFNRISKIEGLDALERLSDLSLFHNSISALEGLDSLRSLHVLSLGDNQLSSLAAVTYLRRCTNLRMLTLSGNPLSKAPDYTNHVLSHVSGLVCLDWRRVTTAAQAAAEEAHQDEVAELREKEAAAAEEAAAAAERAAHAAAMSAANLAGVEALLEEVVVGDGEWAAMAGVPGLLDGWSDTRDKYGLAVEEFKALVLEARAAQAAEAAQFAAARDALLSEGDAAARAAIAAFERSKKEAAARLAEEPGGDNEYLVDALKAKLAALREGLLEGAALAQEDVASLCAEYERALGEGVDAAKQLYTAFFTQVRDLLAGFSSALSAAALPLIERFSGASADAAELDAMADEAQALVADKDALMGAIQGSHHHQIALIDALEDRLHFAEAHRASAAAAMNADWASSRHRERVCELLAHAEGSVAAVDRLAAQAAAGTEAAAARGGDEDGGEGAARRAHARGAVMA